MTTVELAENLAAEEDCGEFPHVLGGVVLIGAAARLARMLDRGILGRGGLGSADQGVVVAGGTSIVGPDGVPGRGMPEHASVPVSRCVIGASRV